MASFQVSFRLSQEAWKQYSAEAEARDLPLGTFLRRRLEHQEQVLATEADLRARSAAPAATENGPTSPAAMRGTLVELILLLRSIAGPERSRVARSEVVRQGLPTCDLGGRTADS